MSAIKRDTQRVKGKPKFMFKAEDRGTGCFITIPRPIDEDSAHRLVQAVGLLMVGMSETLAKSGHTCQHMGCNFNLLMRTAISEMRDAHPVELERAIEQMNDLQKVLSTGRKDEPLH